MVETTYLITSCKAIIMLLKFLTTFFLKKHWSKRRLQVSWYWRWRWIVFVVWMTEEKRLALLPAGTIFRDPHYRESPRCCEPILGLCWTFVNWSCTVVIQYCLVSNTCFKYYLVKNMRLWIKQDAGWYGRASFAGKSFDSVHFIPL